MRNTISIVCLFFSVFFVAAQKESPSKLSLQEAIQYAIQNSYDVKIAENDIEKAIKRKWETTAIGLPQIEGKVEYQNFIKQRVNVMPARVFNPQAPEGQLVAFPGGIDQTAGVSATLTQLLFDGSYLVGLQSAKTFLKISEQAKEKTKLATREAIINAYGNVLVSEKAIEILKRNKSVLEKNLNETQKIYDNGLVELENVEQLQITLGTLNNNLRNAQRMSEIARQMLNVSLGNPISKKIELTDTLDSLAEKNADLGLLGKAFNINKHIDYQIAKNSRESKRLMVKYEKSKYLPSLGAFVNAGTNAYSTEFDFLDSNKKWYFSSLFGFNLTIPIFGSGKQGARVKQAALELENADIRLKEIEQKLNLQAQTAKSEYQLSIENLATAKENLSLAERIEKKQQIKFFEGISSSFDLSQAQNQLYTQQNNYIQAMLNVIARKAKLETALNLPINK